MVERACGGKTGSALARRPAPSPAATASKITIGCDRRGPVLRRLDPNFKGRLLNQNEHETALGDLRLIDLLQRDGTAIAPRQGPARQHQSIGI